MIILTRRPKAASGKVSYAAWNPADQTVDLQAIQQADYIINLVVRVVINAGPKSGKEIVDSRVESGR